MHPYVVEQLVEDRRRELGRLRHPGPGDGSGRLPGRPEAVGAWRRRASRALLGVVVALGVPRGGRAPARQSVATLLGLGCGPGGEA
jgi:hypothetical protein